MSLPVGEVLQHTHTHYTHTHAHAYTHAHTHIHTSGDFSKTASEARLKNMLKHVQLEDFEFVQNQLFIAGRLTQYPSHSFP